MSATAVIRVKRRIQDEPLNAFVLNCKKQKIGDPTESDGLTNDTDDATAQLTIVKFAGTVENQDNIEKHIKKITKSEAQDIAKKIRQPPQNATVQNRLQQQNQAAHENRFKVVNCFRAASAANNGTLDANKNITVVDIERHPANVNDMNDIGANCEISTSSTNTTAATSQSPSSEYVYDLYLPDNDEPLNDIMDNILSVQAYNTDLIHENYRDDMFVDSDPDSEDSNDENNWKNDYPDSADGVSDDDDTSTGYDALRRAVETIDLDGDRSLSSDGEDEEYITHAITSTDSTLDHDYAIDSNDIDRYGKAYAKYKSKLLANKKVSKDNSSSSSDSDEYGDCLSDDYYSD